MIGWVYKYIKMYKLSIITVLQNHLETEKFLVVYFITCEEFHMNSWKYLLDQNPSASIQIIQNYYEKTEHNWDICLACLKTFWLNIFKRTWRKKHKCIMKRKNPKALFLRNITGSFPIY